MGYNLSGGRIANIEHSHKVQYGHPVHEKEANMEKLVISDEVVVRKPTGKHITPAEYYDLLKARIPQRRRRARLDSVDERSRGDSV